MGPEEPAYAVDKEPRACDSPPGVHKVGCK